MTLEGAKKALRKGSAASSVERDAELMERLQRIRALLVEVREDLKSDEGVVDDGEEFLSEAARAEAGRKTCGMRSMFDPEPGAFSATEVVAGSESMPEKGVGPDVATSAGEADSAAEVSVRADVPAEMLSAGTDRVAGPEAVAAAGETQVPAESVAKAEPEFGPEREGEVFVSESEPEGEVFGSGSVGENAPEFEAAVVANPDAGFDSATELVTAPEGSSDVASGEEAESASAEAFDTESESVAASEAASGVDSGSETGSGDPDVAVTEEPEDLKGAEEADETGETGEAESVRSAGASEEVGKADETGEDGEAESARGAGEAGTSEVAGVLGGLGNTGNSGNSEEAGDPEEAGEVGESDEADEPAEPAASDEPDFVEIDLLTLRAEQAEKDAKNGRAGEMATVELAGSAGKAAETMVDDLSDGMEMGTAMTSADVADAGNVPEEVEDRGDDDRDGSDNGDHRDDSGDHGGEAGGADDDEPDFVLLDARTLEAVDPEEDDFTAQAGRDEWTAGDASQTASGQPVGRTGRRPRRRKEEVEDKELFAFYEQSLF